jgi:hypothetical protein
MAIDLSKPIRRRCDLAEAEYIGKSRVGGFVFAIYDSVYSDHFPSLCQPSEAQAEELFENIPEVRESWWNACLGTAYGTPAPRTYWDTLARAQQESQPSDLGIIHVTYDGATLTADVLTTK